jgi:hypothetical protein
MKLTEYALFMMRARTHATLSHVAGVLSVATVALAVVGNATGAALLFSLFQDQDFARLLRSSSLGIGGLVVILSAFAPAYRPPTDPIPALFPLPRVQRAVAGYLWDLGRVGPVGVVAFFLLVAPFAPAPWQYALSGMAAVFAALAVQRTVGLFLEYRTVLKSAHIGATLGILVMVAAAVKETSPIRAGVLWLGAAAAGTVHHLWLASLVAGAEAGGRAGSRAGHSARHLSPFRRLRTAWLRTPMMRIGVLLALGLKAPSLLILGSRMNNPEWPPWAPVAVLFIATPFPLFSYVFNNAFGPRPALFSTLHVTVAPWRHVVAAYASLILWPAALDIILTSSVAGLLGWINVSFALFYAGTFMLLAALGWFTSLADPRAISGAWVLRPTVSPWITLMISAPVALASAWLYLEGLAWVPAAASVPVLVGIGLMSRRALPRVMARAYEGIN